MESGQGEPVLLVEEEDPGGLEPQQLDDRLKRVIEGCLGVARAVEGLGDLAQDRQLAVALEQSSGVGCAHGADYSIGLDAW